MTAPMNQGPLGGAVPPVTEGRPPGLAFPETEQEPQGQGMPTSPSSSSGRHTGTSPTGSATGSLSDVAGTAAGQGSEVVRETGRQARQLMSTTKDELRQQAASQQTKVAEGLTSLGDELRSMAASSAEPGLASDLAEQAADRLSTMGGWLEDREPGQLVDEVARFAARKPGTFLAIAAGIGLLAGRATRSVASSSEEGRVSTGSAHVDIRDNPRDVQTSADLPPRDVADGIGEEWTAASVGQPVGGDLR